MSKQHTGPWSKRAKRKSDRCKADRNAKVEAWSRWHDAIHNAPAQYLAVAEQIIGPPPHGQKVERRALRILKTLAEMSRLWADQDYRLDFVDPYLGDDGNTLHARIAEMSRKIAHFLACYVKPMYHNGCTSLHPKPHCPCFYCTAKRDDAGEQITLEMVKEQGGVQ